VIDLGPGGRGRRRDRRRGNPGGGLGSGDRTPGSSSGEALFLGRGAGDRPRPGRPPRPSERRSWGVAGGPDGRRRFHAGGGFTAGAGFTAGGGFTAGAGFEPAACAGPRAPASRRGFVPRGRRPWPAPVGPVPQGRASRMPPSTGAGLAGAVSRHLEIGGGRRGLKAPRGRRPHRSSCPGRSRLSTCRRTSHFRPAGAPTPPRGPRERARSGSPMEAPTMMRHVQHATLRRTRSAVEFLRAREYKGARGLNQDPEGD